MTHIERIKKLLRLSRSNNPHEAELAMAKAMELAQEHRLSIEGLDPDEDPAAALTHIYTDAWTSIPYEKQYAAKIAEMFFGCGIVFEDIFHDYRRKQRIVFIGTPTEIEVGQYVFTFLSRHFTHCWKNHRGRCRSRQSYIYGMYQAIFAKLHMGRPENFENSQIALSHRAYINDLFEGGTKTIQKKRPKTTDAAYSRGFAQGAKTEIRPGIKGTKPNPIRLT